MTFPKQTMTMTITIREHPQRPIWETCDIWHTDYISDSLEPEFITIFVTWQLRVTLDRICNSCDVFILLRYDIASEKLTLKGHITWLENGWFNISEYDVHTIMYSCCHHMGHLGLSRVNQSRVRTWSPGLIHSGDTDSLLQLGTYRALPS